jgi:TPR repeat protein
MAAWMCVEGEGGDPDFEYAARTFRKAAKSGDGRAQHQLGWMYLNGDGVVQDDTQAVAWFVKSADKGTPKGQSNLAACHLNGWGVERDVFEAGRLYRLAALQGFAVAQWELGEIFRKGKVYCGVKMELARKYLNMAAEQGHNGASASASASASPSASAKAVAQLAEMNRERLHCAFCGADNAPSECELCHRVRYCDLVCSHAHWRHGGGFKFPGAERRRRNTKILASTRTRAREND